jgi:hypothetical protein
MKVEVNKNDESFTSGDSDRKQGAGVFDGYRLHMQRWVLRGKF